MTRHLAIFLGLLPLMPLVIVFIVQKTAILILKYLMEQEIPMRTMQFLAAEIITGIM
jgi:hypothetical protein